MVGVRLQYEDWRCFLVAKDFQKFTSRNLNRSPSSEPSEFFGLVGRDFRVQIQQNRKKHGIQPGPVDTTTSLYPVIFFQLSF